MKRLDLYISFILLSLINYCVGSNKTFKIEFGEYTSGPPYWSRSYIGGFCDCDGFQPDISQVIRRKANFLKYQYVKVNYEGNKLITCIKAMDIWKDGTDGYVAIIDGGVNHYYVVMVFSTLLSRGMRFKLQIFTDICVQD